MADLADILNIKGNRPVYDRLQQLLKHGSATALVGAGASAGLYPLWPDLVAALANKPVELGLATETDERHWLRVAEKNPLQAVEQIRSVLPDQYYYPFLFDTFKDREPHYTKTHSVLMRMNFRAWLTTNYDSGLIAAGGLNRYTVWNSTYEINRWLSGDVFKEGRRLVLFAHGYYADPPGIILDRGSYRAAYKSGPYRRLFESLWLQHEMVFVGFGFNDVVLGQIADEVLHDAGAPSVRHIAILGLSEEYTPELRKEFLEPYNAEILFYPVKGKDHSALATLLESLVPPVPATSPDSRQTVLDSESAAGIRETKRTHHSIGSGYFGGISAEANRLVCGVGSGPDDMETVEFPISEPEESVERALSFFELMVR